MQIKQASKLDTIAVNKENKIHQMIHMVVFADHRVKTKTGEN